jgi:hypothetical protein
VEKTASETLEKSFYHNIWEHVKKKNQYIVFFADPLLNFAYLWPSRFPIPVSGRWFHLPAGSCKQEGIAIPYVSVSACHESIRVV